MSSAATQAQEAHQLAASDASHSKRKREEAEDHARENVAERKHGFDLDILACPICMEPFSPPVYQCNSGHTARSACCEKLISKKCPSCTRPTGSIRCNAIEKLVESLTVSCKYARHGCNAEFMRRPGGIEDHEAHCVYEPFRCPLPECNYKASRYPLLSHLTGCHQTKTVATCNNNTGVTFIMDPSDRTVIIKETRLFYIVHREVHENLGDIFFCTSFQGSNMATYNLTVWHRSGCSVPHSMESARPIYLRCLTEYLKDFLVVPAKDCRPHQSFDLNFNVPEYYNYDD